MAYLFNTPEDISAMLATIGAASIDELFASIPPHLRLAKPLAIPAALSELELTRRMGELASRNTGVEQAVCFLGGGAYDHFIPAVVDSLASRGEFYTSYTPYQPEVSQGNLQVMFEYETLICQLTGMDVSNASLYDGATAMIEAVLLAMASSPNRSAWWARTGSRSFGRVPPNSHCPIRPRPPRSSACSLESSSRWPACITWK